MNKTLEPEKNKSQVSRQDNSQMYREHILELYKEPLNFGHLKNATNKYRAHNPLCGDDINIELILKDGIVTDVKFSGSGCAITTAAASLVTNKIKGMKKTEVMKLKKEDIIELLKIEIGPVRLKCALLPLEAIHKSISESTNNSRTDERK